ncbi:MAG: PQQ-binding-like beta-propeller repeat protein, partial [Spirochaetia bacterium]
NVFVGTGEHSGTYLEGSNVRIRAERDGYANVRITQSISESTPAMRIIELEPRPIEGDYHIADSPIIGEILRFGNVFVAVSADGRLIGFESGGAVSWVNETANTENRNNQPVAAAGRVVLTGGIEMVVNDPQSGSELVQRSLPSSDNHMFGRRVVPFPGGLLFPRNRGIDLVSLETGETYEEIAIPRAAGMTPGYYDEIIIMCNQRGDMFFYNESGEMIGEVETPADQIRALSPVVHEGRVYLANRKGLVVCVDLDSRSLVWDRDVDPDANMQVFHDLVVTDYGIFMYDLRHNIVYALNTENGQELYPPIQNVSCPPGVAGGELLYGTMTDDFIIAEADTGRDVSSLNVDANVVTRPSVYEGRILVGTDNGRVLVINPAGLE